MSIENPTNYPRLLVIDATRINSLNATGQVKKNFLKNWPEENFMQLYESKLSYYPLARFFNDPSSDLVYSNKDSLIKEINSFKPEVIYYRPLLDQHLLLHLLVLEVLAHKPVPLVTHIMDDWPTRMATEDPGLAEITQQELKALFARSHKALSISEKMSSAFKKRYGVDFEPISNGIDPALYGNLCTTVNKNAEKQEGLLMRYSGALAKNMTFHTVKQIAQAVDSLQNEIPVKFEIYTMARWRQSIEEAVKNLRGVSVFNSVSDEDYPRLLAGADVLVLGYNFDAASINYVRYSMANKLPEYLATGKPVLAVGPAEVAGIEYLLSKKLAHCITEPDYNQIRHAIKYLAEDSDYRRKLGKKGQEWAFNYLNINYISKRFQEILCQAAESETTPTLRSGHETFSGIDCSILKLHLMSLEYDQARNKLSKLIDRVENRREKIKFLREELETIRAKANHYKREVVHLVYQLKQKEYECELINKDVELLGYWMEKLRGGFHALATSTSWMFGSTIADFLCRIRFKEKPKPVFENVFDQFRQFDFWKKKSGKDSRIKGEFINE